MVRDALLTAGLLDKPQPEKQTLTDLLRRVETLEHAFSLLNATASHSPRDQEALYLGPGAVLSDLANPANDLSFFDFATDLHEPSAPRYIALDPMLTHSPVESLIFKAEDEVERSVDASGGVDAGEVAGPVTLSSGDTDMHVGAIVLCDDASAPLPSAVHVESSSVPDGPPRFKNKKKKKKKSMDPDELLMDEALNRAREERDRLAVLAEADLTKLSLVIAQKKVTCPAGHDLQVVTVPEEIEDSCMKCRRHTPVLAVVARCDPCDVTLCHACATTYCGCDGEPGEDGVT